MWKAIKEFTDYEVSNTGKVRRVKSAANNHATKELTPRNNGRGYLYVALYNEGKRSNKAIHILVAEAFIPNPNHYPEVNHIGPKSDNRAHRLEWRTKQGHKQDQAKRGQKGEGVTLRKDKKKNKWQARYSPAPRQRKSLGFFSTKKEAKDARDAAVKALPRLD